VGEQFIYRVNATDPDGDTLTYYTDTTLFNINPQTGEIIFTPSAKDIGKYEITIYVTDGKLDVQETVIFEVHPAVEAIDTESPLAKLVDWLRSLPATIIIGLIVLVVIAIISYLYFYRIKWHGMQRRRWR
jgi:hypothetical protein